MRSPRNYPSKGVTLDIVILQPSRDAMNLLDTVHGLACQQGTATRLNEQLYAFVSPRYQYFKTIKNPTTCMYEPVPFVRVLGFVDPDTYVARNLHVFIAQSSYRHVTWFDSARVTLFDGSYTVRMVKVDADGKYKQTHVLERDKNELLAIDKE